MWEWLRRLWLLQALTATISAYRTITGKIARSCASRHGLLDDARNLLALADWRNVNILRDGQRRQLCRRSEPEPATDTTTPSPTPTATPFLSALVKVRGEIPPSGQFFFPGHAAGRHALAGSADLQALRGSDLYKHDLPELDGLDNLHAPEPGGALHEALLLTQRLYGSRQSWFLVNGSTGGLLTCIVALAAWARQHRSTSTSSPRRPRLLITRDAHKAVFDALWVAQCDALVLPCRVQPDFQVSLGADPAALLGALQGILEEEGRDGVICGLVLTRPTYQGLVLPAEVLQAVCALCHSHGVPVLVDEAHGGHLRLLPASLGLRDALQCGADLAVQSSHKTLTALTQSAMLHAGPECFPYLRAAQRDALLRLLHRSFSALHSTSPSALLLASLDAARAHAASPAGQDEMAEAAAAGLALRNAIRGPSLALLDDTLVGSGYGVDPLRLTVRFPGCRDATLVDDALCEAEGLYCELNLPTSITYCLPPGLARGTEAFHLLQNGLAAAARGEYHPEPEAGARAEGRPAPEAEEAVATLTLTEAEEAVATLVDAGPALEGWQDEAVSLDGPALPGRPNPNPNPNPALPGRLSAETVCPYPPGIPLVIQGERLTRGAVAALCELRGGLASGRSVTGAADASLATLRVYVDPNPHPIPALRL